MNHFHDHNGMLIVGLDRHFGVHWPTPFPIPMFFWELNVMHPFWMGAGKPTVMFNGHVSVADQHKANILWPHIPVIPDPLNMFFPLDLLMGNQKTWLAKGTVFVEGAPGAITLAPGPWSLNLDCWTGSNLPPGVVFQPGTVVTSASWQDYVAAAIRLGIEIIKEYIASRGKVANTRQGRIPGRPANYGWRNVRQNMSYMGRSGAAGGRARSTFRNALGREFADRMTPWSAGRDAAGRPVLNAPGAGDLARWAGDKLFGLPTDAGSALDFADDVAHNAASGQGPLSGVVPGSPGDAAKDALTGVLPQYGAVEGLQQSQGNRDFNPFG